MSSRTNLDPASIHLSLTPGAVRDDKTWNAAVQESRLSAMARILDQLALGSSWVDGKVYKVSKDTHWAVPRLIELHALVNGLPGSSGDDESPVKRHVLIRECRTIGCWYTQSGDGPCVKCGNENFEPFEPAKRLRAGKGNHEPQR